MLESNSTAVGKKGPPSANHRTREVYCTRAVPNLIDVENLPSERDPRSLPFDGNFESREC